MNYVIWGTNPYAKIILQKSCLKINAFIKENGEPVCFDSSIPIVNEDEFLHKYTGEYILISDPFKYYHLRIKLINSGLKEIFNFAGGFEYLPLMELFNDRKYRINYWTENNELYSFWDSRTKQMSQYISPDITSVVDLGCGNSFLKKLLSPNIQYIGCDYLKRTSDTYIYNFNNHEFPGTDTDLFFVSGCLEYLNDPDWFLNQLSKAGKMILISYLSLECMPNIRRRRELGYQNHFSSLQLIHALEKNAFSLQNAHRSVCGDIIFTFERRIPND